MLSTEIFAVTLGLMACTAYSAPTGIINSRGPQSDTQPVEDAAKEAFNKIQPAPALKSRGLELDAREPQDPFSDAIDELVNGRRSVQALKARAPQDPFSDAIDELVNGRRGVQARSPQNPFDEAIDELVNGRRGVQARSPQNPFDEAIDELVNGRSRKSRSAQNADQGAVFESVNRILPATGRRV